MRAKLDRTGGQVYQALNIEEEEEDDDESDRLEEAENTTEFQRPRRRNSQTQSLSTRIEKLRNSRYNSIFSKREREDEVKERTPLACICIYFNPILASQLFLETHLIGQL